MYTVTMDVNANPQALSIDRNAQTHSSFPRQLDELTYSANQSVSTPCDEKDKQDAISDNEYAVEKGVRYNRQAPEIKKISSQGRSTVQRMTYWDRQNTSPNTLLSATGKHKYESKRTHHARVEEN